jgi:hypothetical protein
VETNPAAALARPTPVTTVPVMRMDAPDDAEYVGIYFDYGERKLQPLRSSALDCDSGPPAGALPAGAAADRWYRSRIGSKISVTRVRLIASMYNGKAQLITFHCLTVKSVTIMLITDREYAAALSVSGVRYDFTTVGMLAKISATMLISSARSGSFVLTQRMMPGP